MRKFFTSWLLITLTAVMIGCNDDPPGTETERIVFSSAKGDYYGNHFETGTDFFKVTFEGANYKLQIGLFNEALPEGDELAIRAGSYQAGSVDKGEASTFLPGSDQEYGTIFWEKNPNGSWGNAIPVNSGSFTIQESDGKYKFTINLKTNSGEDVESVYEGTLQITDHTAEPPPGGKRFENMIGWYRGNFYSTGTDALIIYFYNGTYLEGEGFSNEFEVLEVHFFTSKTSYEEVKLDEGTYTMTQTPEGTPMTFFGEDDITMGWLTRYQKFQGRDHPDNVMVVVAGGEFTVNSTGGYGYDIDFDLSGYLVEWDEEKNTDVVTDKVYEIKSQFKGDIGPDQLSDISPDEENFYNFGEFFYYGQVTRDRQPRNEEIGYFRIELTHTSGMRPDKLYLELYSDLVENPSHNTLTLKEGTYTINNTEDHMTAYIGQTSYGTASGCYLIYTIHVYDEKDIDIAAFKEGSVTIKKEGDWYSVELNPTAATDYRTGNPRKVLDSYYYEGGYYGYYIPQEDLLYEDLGIDKGMMIYNHNFLPMPIIDSHRITLNLWDSSDSLTRSRVTFYIDPLDDDQEAHIPDGIYNFGTDYAYNTIAVGSKPAGTGLQHTYLERLHDGQYIISAYFTDGTMEVNRISGNEYEITIDFTGPDTRAFNKNCRYRQTFTGELDVIDRRKE